MRRIGRKRGRACVRNFAPAANARRLLRPHPLQSPTSNVVPPPPSAPVVRSAYAATIVETEIKNPSLYGWGSGPAFWNNCKHVRFAEHNGFLYQHSGDYAGFPRQQRSDYPPNPYWGENQRQDMWRASLAPNATGRIEWELSQNFYHNYPWNGSAGRLSPEPQRGPFMPDALGWVVDKRGDFWSGPWGSGYTGVTGDAAGLAPEYAAMFKWNMPGVHSNGIRLGDGWTLPPQDRLGIDVSNPGARYRANHRVRLRSGHRRDLRRQSRLRRLPEARGHPVAEVLLRPGRAASTPGRRSRFPFRSRRWAHRRRSRRRT